jgi:hypothetical protein
MSAYQNTQYQAVGNYNNNNYAYNIQQEQRAQNRRSKWIVRKLFHSGLFLTSVFLGCRLSGRRRSAHRDWRRRGGWSIKEPQE